jgi:hypothetical protein
LQQGAHKTHPTVMANRNSRINRNGSCGAIIYILGSVPLFLWIRTRLPQPP